MLTQWTTQALSISPWNVYVWQNTQAILSGAVLKHDQQHSALQAVMNSFAAAESQNSKQHELIAQQMVSQAQIVVSPTCNAFDKVQKHGKIYMR